MSEEAKQEVLFESAHDAADGSLPLPSPTPGILEARDPSAAAPVATPPAGADLDAAGVEFDPAGHEVDPVTKLGRKTVAGLWKRKRGNGARVASGKPLAGATRGRLVLPASEATEAASMAGNGQGSPPEGHQTPNTGALPSSFTVQSIRTEVPPPPPAPGLDDYETTAVGVSHATWGLFRFLGGPKWEPAGDEMRSWSKAWQRVWHHYRLPLIGPLVEVLILGIRAAGDRSEGTKARGWMAGAWRWLRGGSFAEPQERPSRQEPDGVTA